MDSILTTEQAANATGDGLIAEIERRKRLGNEHYARRDLNASMQAWLAAIWLLKVNRPPYPKDLDKQVPPTDVRAASLLSKERSSAIYTSGEQANVPSSRGSILGKRRWTTAACSSIVTIAVVGSVAKLISFHAACILLVTLICAQVRDTCFFHCPSMLCQTALVTHDHRTSAHVGWRSVAT